MSNWDVACGAVVTYRRVTVYHIKMAYGTISGVDWHHSCHSEWQIDHKNGQKCSNNNCYARFF
ncbi:MAG: hypothetical protein DDT26_02737 [Dehalococcoidia bacterium]|nr:hypothetical protein [Chloroflexota bacterium]